MIIRLEIQELLAFAKTIYDEITTLHGPYDRMPRRLNISLISNYDPLLNESLQVQYRFRSITAIAVKGGNLRDVNLEQCNEDSTNWICANTVRCCSLEGAEGVCNTRIYAFILPPRLHKLIRW